ncbi:hypothetical protein O0L34_g2087 [Tuta absoluta]|nr:hypothetical protein O0L34_g2087 [Tuta absoluta]
MIILAVWPNIETSPESYENEYGDDYGSEWLYFVDDNGTTQIMNFSAIPANSMGMFFGDAYFTLYTRRNLDSPEQITLPQNGSPLQSKYFNASNKLKILTHGWMSSDSTLWLQNIKDNYLRKYDYNIITVDWSEIAHNPSYVWPALSTRYVGKRVAKMVSSFKEDYGLSTQDVHLIGHSLGAQVMGYAGMFSQERISRITGLDPARPMFEFPYMPSDFRLEKSDAEFVDIIHTCGGVLGYRMSHGHADFYPNNGRAKQPGCEGRQMMMEGCSHGRSCEFFGESVESDPPFTAYPCKNWQSFQDGECKSDSTSMGDPVSPESRGDYYLHTRNSSKYATGDDQNQ